MMIKFDNRVVEILKENKKQTDVTEYRIYRCSCLVYLLSHYGEKNMYVRK